MTSSLVKALPHLQNGNLQDRWLVVAVVAVVVVVVQEEEEEEAAAEEEGGGGRLGNLTTVGP